MIDASRIARMAEAERMCRALANATGDVWVVIGDATMPVLRTWRDIRDERVIGVARPTIGFWGVVARVAIIVVGVVLGGLVRMAWAR